LLDAAGTATPGGRHPGAWPDDVARALPAGPRAELARLAVARAADREPEQACYVAQEAAAIITNTWSARAVAELRRLPALLAPWPDLAPVAELRETLAALP
jgi:hypothetical protein